jgi:hypothetical protein
MTSNHNTALEALNARVTRLEKKVDDAIVTIGTMMIDRSEPHMRPLVAFNVYDVLTASDASHGPLTMSTGAPPGQYPSFREDQARSHSEGGLPRYAPSGGGFRSPSSCPRSGVEVQGDRGSALLGDPLERLKHIVCAMKVEERRRLMESCVPCGMEAVLSPRWQ